MQTIIRKTIKNLAFFLMTFSAFKGYSLDSYPLPTGSSDKAWKVCTSKTNHTFSFTNSSFKEKKKDMENLEKAANLLGQERYKQALCLKNLKLSPTEKEGLAFFLEKVLEKEEELLGYAENLWRWQERNLPFTFAESKILTEYFSTKRQIYHLLYRRTTDIVLGNTEDVDEKVLQQIYLSSLRLEYEMLESLRPEARTIILKKIHGS